MSRSAEADWTPFLDPDERVLWSGQPLQGWALSKIDIFLIPFSLLWSIGALAGLSAALVDGALTIAPFALLFGGIAFYITVGRFMHDARRRKRTRYAITDRRALILRGGANLQSRGLGRDLAVALTAGPRSTIALGEQPFFFGFARSLDPFGMLRDFTFFRIEDGERVYRLIRQVQNGQVRSGQAQNGQAQNGQSQNGETPI